MTATYSNTFTVADVRKVIDCFAADYDMVAQSTGLETTQRVTDTIHDVQLLAAHGYLDRADIVLADSAGRIVQAAKYVVSTDASLWTLQQPGNSLWPRTPGGSLSIVVSYTQKWHNLGQVDQQSFRQQLNLGWTPSKINLSYPGLSGQFDRRYASNAFGVERTSYR